MPFPSLPGSLNSFGERRRVLGRCYADVGGIELTRTESLIHRTESEQQNASLAWKLAMTTVIMVLISAAALWTYASGATRVRELSDARDLTLQKNPQHKQNAMQNVKGLGRTSSDTEVRLSKFDEDKRMHRSVAHGEVPRERCERNVDYDPSKGQDDTSFDRRREELSSTLLQAADDIPEDSQEEETHYCPYFDNRAPTAQPNLVNCTWYQARSCCLQREIDIIFLATYPLSAASDACQKQLSFLYCYICAPKQNTFYRAETLTVCETFCDRIFAACGSATWKGSSIRSVYSSGRDFCLRRSFRVGNLSDGRCFDYEDEETVSGVGQRTRPLTSLVVLVLVMNTLCVRMKAHLCW